MKEEKNILLESGKIFSRKFLIKKNEKKSFLYRNTNINWLKEFLENNIIYPRDSDFISLSFKADSGVKRKDFGRIRIVFDKNIIFKQGGYPLDYDHLTDIEVAHLEGITMMESDDEDKWDLIIQDIDIEKYRDEEEVVIDKLKYIKGIIIKVCLLKEEFKKIETLLKKNDIKYYFNYSNCS